MTYFLNALAPGDPVVAMINPEEYQSLTQEDIEARRVELGLDKPIIVRYFLWLTEALQGNLGYSIARKEPVLNLIVDRLPETLLLTTTALTLAVAIGTTLGILAALKQYSVFDFAFSAIAFLGLSVPSFFFALLGIYIFSVSLGWLPVFGMFTPGEERGLNGDLLRHAILPVAALAIPNIGDFMRYARSATLEAMTAPHIVAARAKGLSERALTLRHILRNSLLPLITVIGLSLPGTIGGSFVIETIFSWPGIGMMAFDAVLQRDYPLQIGIALVLAVAVLASTLVTDIAYAVADPRIRYE